jgi:hypothetical protein
MSKFELIPRFYKFGRVTVVRWFGYELVLGN